MEKNRTAGCSAPPPPELWPPRVAHLWSPLHLNLTIIFRHLFLSIYLQVKIVCTNDAPKHCCLKIISFNRAKHAHCIHIVTITQSAFKRILLEAIQNKRTILNCVYYVVWHQLLVFLKARCFYLSFQFESYYLIIIQQLISLVKISNLLCQIFKYFSIKNKVVIFVMQMQRLINYFDKLIRNVIIYNAYRAIHIVQFTLI